MKQPKIFLLLSMLMINLSMQSANAQFSVTGEFRTLSEHRYGYSTLPYKGVSPSFFTTQRSRLNVAYKDLKTESYLSLQDVRVWGDEEQLKDIAGVAINEAWSQINFSENSALKIGRQELVYDDHRLLGNVDWIAQSRSHDAVVFKLKNKNSNLHIGGAYNQQASSNFGTVYTLNNYKALGFVWFYKNFSENFSGSLINIADGYQPDDTTQKTALFRFTMGPNLTYNIQNVVLKNTLYWQGGKDKANKTINAFLFAFSASYSLPPLIFTGGMDYLSGTDATNASNNENNSFNTLYATNHKFYGYLDYFTDIPKHTKNGGLLDAFFKMEYKQTDKISYGLDYHYFTLANNVKDTKSQMLDKFLASELDSYLNYSFTKNINFKLGYSALLASGSLETIKGGDKNYVPGWGWLMISMKPELFKQ